MTRNVGAIDRSLRILVGLVLIALAATGTVGWWGWPCSPVSSAGARPTRCWASAPARPAAERTGLSLVGQRGPRPSA